MGSLIQQAATKNAVAKKNPTLKDMINQMQGEIAKALPSVITSERFTRIVLSAISNTPQLGECSPTSFLGAMMNAAQLGLEPNTPLGQAYLIPFKNNKKGITECQFQIGYKGLIDIAYRSGNISSIEARVVYEHDEFEYELGLNAQLRHKPCMTGDRGKPIAVYGMFKLVNGGYYFEVMSTTDINKHAAKYSQAYNSSFSPWKTNYEEMAKKTVIKKVLKYAPLKTEFARAVDADTATLNFEKMDSGENEIVIESYDEPEELPFTDLPSEEEAALAAQLEEEAAGQ